MMPRSTHTERHRTDRIGWPRAAVLGANDGAVSVASLVVGVAAAPSATPGAVLLAGTAALVAGAMSMAAGEYVSVRSQADTEAADPEGERAELVAIYEARGLDAELAVQVARQLMEHDALGAHGRDELGITEALRARPLQAALASAAAFAIGAALPLGTTFLVPRSAVVLTVGAATVLTLLLLGALAAYAGGAPLLRGALRVATWGILAMAATAAVGKLVGVAL